MCEARKQCEKIKLLPLWLGEAQATAHCKLIHCAPASCRSTMLLLLFKGSRSTSLAMSLVLAHACRNPRLCCLLDAAAATQGREHGDGCLWQTLCDCWTLPAAGDTASIEHEPCAVRCVQRLSRAARTAACSRLQRARLDDALREGAKYCNIQAGSTTTVLSLFCRQLQRTRQGTTLKS